MFSNSNVLFERVFRFWGTEGMPVHAKRGWASPLSKDGIGKSQEIHALRYATFVRTNDWIWWSACQSSRITLPAALERQPLLCMPYRRKSRHLNTHLSAKARKAREHAHFDFHEVDVRGPTSGLKYGWLPLLSTCYNERRYGSWELNVLQESAIEDSFIWSLEFS